MSEWVSVSEASRRLKVSPSTIRRMIESGELEGEREPLAKGSRKERFLVKLPAWVNLPLDHPDRPAWTRRAPETPHDASPPESDEASRALDILDALLRANAETMERQASQIAELSLDNGRLRAEVCHEAERRAALERERDEARAALRARPWWRRLFD